jgi:hypothetical protein
LNSVLFPNQERVCTFKVGFYQILQAASSHINIKGISKHYL